MRNLWNSMDLISFRAEDIVGQMARIFWTKVLSKVSISSHELKFVVIGPIGSEEIRG
jgi:hypothetical protein